MSPSTRRCLGLVALASSAAVVAAHPGCHGQELMRRQRTDTEQSAAISTDPTTECTPYSYPPVAAMISSYPAIWQIANLSQSGLDATALQLYQQIQSSIPNIAPKGTPDGNFSNTTPSYSPQDPDCWWSYSRCTTPKASGLPSDVTECPEPNTWGFTVDDGPNCSHNAYYNYLQEHNQKATLFYIGSNVVDWPLEAQRGLADGHEICAHTWSHRYMTALSNEQAFAELYFSKKAIKDVIGVTPQCWRPPFGDVDDRIRYIAKALGMITILWTEDTNDFRFATIGQPAVNANYQQIIQGGTNGTYNTHGLIVLTHELNNDTMQTNQNFLPQIQQAFKYVAPVAVCLNNSQPYVEGSAYTYPNFAQWAAGQRNATLAAPSASANAPISLPVSSGQTGSVSASVAYASPTATQGVSGGASGGSSGGSSSGGSKASGSSSSSSDVAPLRMGAASVLAGLAGFGALVGALVV